MNATPTDRLFGVVAGHGPAATKLVANALSVASQAHHGQFRRSGDPYITHPVAVAATVADLGADTDTIATALLHDVPGDTAHTLEQLRAEFGDPIGDLLAAFARIDQADFFDDMTGVDPRAVTLKIADRLHNMQTIQCLEKSVQQRKANQTRQLVARLHDRLGSPASRPNSTLSPPELSGTRSLDWTPSFTPTPSMRPTPESAPPTACSAPPRVSCCPANVENGG